ncbi:MAG TPA: thiamine pyrophosphate-dependent enzyme [Gammaproteobacteria bacterium]|nr:thiamine pyrophosphate-dependent enzyme [Gammaproteobacteria bacterium]
MADDKTASDLLVERLIEWGVDTAFGLPGDGINGFYEALRTHSDKIRLIHVRHEEAAAMAASGYGKFTGKPALCVATAAPGAIHLLNGLYDARIDQSPVIAVTGMTYHDVIGTHFLQDINHDAVLRDACWYSQRVMGEAHVINVTDMAMRFAIAHRGPVHLSIPIDIQAGKSVTGDRTIKNPPGSSGDILSQRQRRIPPREELQRAADALKGKKKPVIFAGAGARGAGDEVEQLAEKLGAPIVKPLLGKDCVPDDSPYCTGGYALVGTRPSQEAMADCDAFIMIGTSSPYIGFMPKPGSAVGVQIDDLPERLGLRYPVEVGLAGDAKLTLKELTPLLSRNDDRNFLETAQRNMRDWRDLMKERATVVSDDGHMKSEAVSYWLSRALADNAILCGDSGTVTTLAARTELKRGQNFSFSGTMCSMAAALPYAIGAQVAHPDRQVVALTGDGSLSMMMGDLATCAQHNLPVKVVVVKNNLLGLIKWEQMAYLGNPEYGVDLAPIDFIKVAEGCGFKAFHMEKPDDCEKHLKDALNTPGPVLVEVVVDPNEMPLTPIIKKQHARNLAKGLARGEPNRERIALTMSRAMAREMTYAASPAGVVGRAEEKIKDKLSPKGKNE